MKCSLNESNTLKNMTSPSDVYTLFKSLICDMFENLHVKIMVLHHPVILDGKRIKI